MTVEQPESTTDQNDQSVTESALESDDAALEDAVAADIAEAHQDGSVDTIDSLRAKLEDAEKRALRYQADLENFRRRKQKDTQDQLKYASMPLINNLLEVLDNLDRALEAVGTEDSAGSLKQGVEIVATQLVAALQHQGCTRIPTVGHPFDPHLHEAVQMQPSDEIDANHIVSEVQSGYTLHDRVVRPAKVVVSTGS